MWRLEEKQQNVLLTNVMIVYIGNPKALEDEVRVQQPKSNVSSLKLAIKKKFFLNDIV